MRQHDCQNDLLAFSQFLQIQNFQLIDLKENLERFGKLLPVFNFNNSKFDLNLIESYFLPISVKERDFEPTVIEKHSSLKSFKFVAIQFLDIMNFPGRATSFVSFFKLYKPSERKRFLPYKWFDHPDKMQNAEFLPYDAFYNKLCSFNPLKIQYTHYTNLLKSGLTTEKTVIKMKLLKPHPTGFENCQKLQQLWR